MGTQTKIQWTDHTFNPWVGCQKVSEGCDNCYAEVNTFVRVQRSRGRELWGNRLRSERHVASDAKWREPLRWNAAAEAAGERYRVFPSMCDPFEDRPELEQPRARLYQLILDTPHLDWLLLTKRPENVVGMMPPGWSHFPRNVWIGTSAENQARWNERIPPLIAVPAFIVFVSAEPLLGPIDCGEDLDYIDWVIVGGESGPGARPFDVGWARDLVGQCNAAGAAVFVKQLGANVRDRNDAGFDAFEDVCVDTGMPTNSTAWPEPLEVEHDPNGFREEYQGAPVRVRLRDPKGGDMDEWPVDLRVREMPTTPAALAQVPE